MKGFLYQSFCFDNAVKDHFYVGNNFLSYRPDQPLGEQLTIAREIALNNDFMPVLQQQIENLLGEGNYHYDFWEFGPDGFSLFWWIRKKVYNEKIALLNDWFKYMEMERYVDFYLYTPEEIDSL
jgi:hypothetical protein